MSEYERPAVARILHGLGLPKPLIQIIVGPRQVGKSTAAQQIAGKWRGPVVKGSADQALPPGPEWIEAHWQRARSEATPDGTVLLVLDEIQKVHGWSETVKALWDDSVNRNEHLKVILLGSSSLLIQKGLTESLAGRFLLHRMPHWGYSEMKRAFDFTLDQWVYFGGYPGAAALVQSEESWHQYVRDSLVETVITRDVLQLQAVAKPALLRHLFILAMHYPSQVLSFSKMLGQLQDAGNTTTLSHYLHMLESAFLLSGLEMYKKGVQRKRGSSPKLIAWNNALISAVRGVGFESARSDRSWWGRMVENAVGAHLLNTFQDISIDVCYWRHRDQEVDFVVGSPRMATAIEVKSGSQKPLDGLQAFLKAYPGAQTLVVGGSGVPLEEFFLSDPRDLLNV